MVPPNEEVTDVLMTQTHVPITVSGKNISITPALEEHAVRKVQKALRRFDDHSAVRADVVLRTERHGQVAEVTVVVGGYFLRGEGRTPDMYLSINRAVSRIEGQLRKFKAKTNRSRIYENGKASTYAPQMPEAQVVKRKRFVLNPMDIDEAILQMELLGHDFFVFMNVDSFEVNVVYRRKDGNYGLIEPILG